AIAEKNEHHILSSEEKTVSIIFSGLVLGLSRTFWKQSTSVEVYSLHIFLILAVIYFLLRAYIKNTPAGESSIKNWIMFAAALALAFSNHLTTILIIPGAAYLYFDKNRFGKDSVKKIIIMLICFLPLLALLYSYLPLRASANPEINWGNPVDMERILRHVSGKQYQVWLFESMDSARKQFNYFVSNFPSEFAFTGLLFIAAGVIASFIAARKLLIFLGITFIFTLFYSINYDIVDIDSYFLLAYIACGFFALMGIQKIFTMVKPEKSISRAGLAIVAVFILCQFYLNFREVNQSGIRTFEDYTKAILQTADKNSIILSYQWDYFVSESYYYQHVEGLRKDITVIDKELLRRSWYYNQLERNHPEAVKKLAPYTAPFLEALKPFEESKNFNPDLLEKGYRDIMTHLVTDNLPERSVYIAPELVEGEMSRGEFVLPEGYYLVPDLLMFRVVKTQDYVPAGDPSFIFRVTDKKSKYIINIQGFAGSMLVRRALYELKFGKSDKAKKYINKVKNDMPDYQIPYDLAKVIN
ncbi:MAG: protein O-mannosyl-transferase family, partial [Syntrophothermus sp.]